MTSRDRSCLIPPNLFDGQQPHVADDVTNGDIQLLINTPRGKASKVDDSYIRKAAIRYKVPYITTVAATVAAAKGITAIRKQKPEVKALQDYHAGIKYDQVRKILV